MSELCLRCHQTTRCDDGGEAGCSSGRAVGSSFRGGSVESHPRVHLIPISEKELVELIEAGCVVDLAFGSGGTALRWVEGQEMPASVRRLGLMRGVFNENMHGAGI